MPSELNAEELALAIRRFSSPGADAFWARDKATILKAAEAHLATLRALVPDWRAALWRAINELHGVNHATSVHQAAINTILDRLEPRAPKDDLASAKAELGKWAFYHPGETWQHFPPSVVRSGHQARVGREYGTERPTKALAVLDALTKARATGGDRG